MKENALTILVGALRHSLTEAHTALVYAISSIRSKKTPVILKRLCTHDSKAVSDTAKELV